MVTYLFIVEEIKKRKIKSRKINKRKNKISNSKYTMTI